MLPPASFPWSLLLTIDTGRGTGGKNVRIQFEEGKTTDMQAPREGKCPQPTALVFGKHTSFWPSACWDSDKPGAVLPYCVGSGSGTPQYGSTHRRAGSGCVWLAGPSTTKAIDDALKAVVKSCEQAIKTRLQRAQHEHALPASTDIHALAGFYYTVIAGIAVKAKAGHSYEQVSGTVQLALSTWPIPTP